MSEHLGLVLKPSKIYFGLSLMVHLITLITAWYYSFNPYVSVVMSGLLLLHWHLLNQRILLKTPCSVQSVNINNKSITTKNAHGNMQKYSQVYYTYQSSFLVIIKTNKASIVIFKDAVAERSLSLLNNFINAQR